MAEPVTQDRQGQMKQVPASPQQQPLHPMASGGASVSLPPSLPTQTTSPQTGINTNGITFNMGKLSLLTISFSLMLLGALTFLGGFLLGLWFAGPSVSSTNMGERPTLGLLPPPSQNANGSQGGGVLQNIAGDAGYTAQSVLSNAPIPDVPSFLTPLVTATQMAVGQQLGYKVQQKLGNGGRQSNSNNNLSPVPQTPLGAMPYQLDSTSPQRSNYAPLPLTPPQGSASPTENTPSSSYGGSEDYTIQLGVYASKENAAALVNQLQSLNFTSYTTESKAPDGRNLYYVHSGHYKDYSTAMEAASQFASKNIPGATVVRVSQKNGGAS
jgi:cell division septation protein DedD